MVVIVAIIDTNTENKFVWVNNMKVKANDFVLVTDGVG